MGNFDLAIKFVLNAEGGYSNHPNDHGGQTNFGITYLTFKEAKKRGIISDNLNSVKDLTLQDAKNIYQAMFWDKINGDALPTDVSIALFDTAVNMGVSASVKMLQGILGVQQDGIVGSQTLSAIQNYSGSIIDDFLDARKTKYEELAERPGQGVFLKGWLNRVDGLRGYIDCINNNNEEGLYNIFRSLWITKASQTLRNIIITLSHQVVDSAQTVVTRDPLILDLDGDGIETISVKDGAYFDHDGNGFAEQTGWASSDDGLLVMDRNSDGVINDGTELFGDQTILQNGQTATDGFQALAELDSNADGIIDVNDTAFSQLKIWQDADGDGYSTPEELFTLDEMGITSINLTHIDTDITDPNGNTQVQSGTFTKTDASTASIGGFTLQRDPTYTIANEWLDVPDTIAALPDLQGYGNVYDLQQAMVRERL